MTIFSRPSGLAAPARRLLALAAIAMLLPAGNLSAEDHAPAKPAIPEPEVVEHAPVPAATSEIERFCSNIADAARDRRYALQTNELQALQAEIDARIAALEEKRAEYEAWVKRREDFLANAEEGVVKIYAGMKPDAAAERLAALETSLAAGILMKLDARKAGVILNEMQSRTAAELTGIMAAAARRSDPS